MGNRILVRTSERTAYKRCRWAWDMSFNHGLRQRRDAPVLRFGTLVHQALAGYYLPGTQRGPHPADLFLDLYEEEVKEAGAFNLKYDDGLDDWIEDEKWSDAKELGEELLEMYIDHYGDDSDWEIIATEHPFQQPVRNPRTGRILFYYVGIVDLVIREISTGHIYIVDHKTTRAIDVHALGLNEQAGSYWTFGTEYLKDKGIINASTYDDLSGIIFNFIRRTRRDTRPQDESGHYLNKDGSVSKRQPSPIFHREPTWRTEHDRDQVRTRALNDFREMEMVKRGDLAVVKNPGPWTCKGCGWLDICELHETGADWHMMLDGTTEEWNPYAEHEIREAEQR
jgi:Zierdtviridae exonuclease